MVNFKEMSKTELKQFLSENRTDDDNFSEALSELLNRDLNPTIYPANMPLADMEKVVRAKIEQTKQSM
jgi:hypothetical protein